MVAWWSFDETFDRVGVNHGALQNGAGVEGKVGSALRLDGDDDGVAIAKSGGALDMGAKNFTIEAWIKADISFQPGSGQAFVFANYAGVPFYALTVHPSDVARFSFRDGDQNYVQATSSSSFKVNDGNWHHIAGVREGTVGHIYIDGHHKFTDDTQPVVGTVNTSGCEFARIGSTNTGPGHCESPGPGTNESQFKGLIDEVSVYDRALNAGEIQDIVNAGAVGKCK